MSRMINQIAQHIRSKNNIVLATHIRPDGDALGSLLGLAAILEGMGKRVVRYLEEPAPALYDFLPHRDLVQTDLSRVLTFAEDCGTDVLCITLDCGDFARLGRSGPALREIHPFLVIDHHQGNEGFGDLDWIEAHRSSTGEMVCDLAVALGVDFTPEAADCLYTAIVTDTGSFQYDSTTEHTLKVAGALVASGVKPARISQALHDSSTFARLQLTQQVLSTLQSFCDDQVGVISVSQDMLQRTGTTLEDCEGLINLPRSVKTVRVAVFLKESNGDTPAVSVSLRSRGDCDVAKIAKQFGGGGHRNAAGFRRSGMSLDDVRAMLLPVLEKALFA
ncbi:MAG: bifunctional oligoribonuclease/PAP phosphatase NrnA [Desulfobulbus sp.]|nr:MAG: bifunctional oligoribonuclease/PAP phosphatase NrnA [Desulfobulbus sp.]